MDPPPVLEIDPLTLAEVSDWRLPAGWTLLPGESVAGAIGAFLEMERRNWKGK